MGWKYDGRTRPEFAATPDPGQTSVWDYPRPPAVERDDRPVIVRARDMIIAESTRALKVMETASPPTFYLPADDVSAGHLRPIPEGSSCEWKGIAVYFDLEAPWGALRRVAWSYPAPKSDYVAIAGHIAFYPARVECFIDGARVQPQPGGFYGGWLTSDIAGPVKGGPGSETW